MSDCECKYTANKSSVQSKIKYNLISQAIQNPQYVGYRRNIILLSQRGQDAFFSNGKLSLTEGTSILLNYYVYDSEESWKGL
jgi:hypothetical protein